MTAGYHYRNWILCLYCFRVFSSVVHSGVVVSMVKFKSNGLGLVPRSGKYDLLLNV